MLEYILRNKMKIKVHKGLYNVLVLTQLMSSIFLSWII